LKSVNVQKAIEILTKGDIVALPTETVYGLGGWIYSDEGLKKIFSTKERPFFDPLIVHVDSVQKARALSSEWTEIHDLFAKNFWPGPLTMIAKKNDLVHPLITSGLDSVGLRCPRHPVALELLSLTEGGIAAPSANKFGKTSPTTSQHVFEEFGDAVAILEGGASEVGIESTVVGILEGGKKIEIYRPGFYTASMIEEVLKKNGFSQKVTYAESPVAPGQLKHHYMPKIPLVIVSPTFVWEQDHSLIESKLSQKFTRPKIWKLNPDPNLASRELYESLRKFDLEGYDLIVTSKLPEHESEAWLGIWNRLMKAKTLSI
jgi:L-threonylcarbamoyladenylate synthase